MIVILLTAIACLGYYSVIVSYAGRGSSFSIMWLLVGLILAGAWAVLMLDKKYGFLNKLPKFIFVILAVAVLLVGLLYFSLNMIVLSKMNAKPSNKADYVIVLGAQIRGTHITKSLRYRLDAAAKYYEENKETTLVVSGGMGQGEATTEAEAMYGYLVNIGVPAEKIILEPKATNTNENLAYSYEIIKNDYKGDGTPSVAICSNNFHIARSLLLAKKQGIAAEGLASKSDSILELNYMVRDSLAIFKEFLKGNI